MSWIYRGIRGEGDPPPGLGMVKGGKILVIGSGRCVWDDLDRYLHKRPSKKQTIQERLVLWSSHEGSGDIMAVNEMGCHLHARVAHWASLHGDHLLIRDKVRRMHNYPPGNVMLHSDKFREDEERKIDFVWPIGNNGGLSGLFAIKAAMLLGYGEIIMAGCPMEGNGRFYDPPDETGAYGDYHVATAFVSELQAPGSEIKNFVRSLSGKTREWLGEPELCAV